MNTIFELAKEGFSFYIEPHADTIVKTTIVGKNNEGKLVKVSALNVYEVVEDELYLESFMNSMIDKLKKTV